MTDLEIAILKTLAYADLFDQALTKTELYYYLIGYKLKSPQQLPQELSYKFQITNELFTLADCEALVQKKDQQQRITQQKTIYVKRWLWAFKLIPWISLVALTGSVAGGTPKDEDDIDILIISQSQRLWLCRLILTPLLTLLHKRRHPQHKPHQVKNKFCLNMWLSLDDLVESTHDLYVASELAHLIPLLNRHQTYQNYLQANSWMRDFLPNCPLNPLAQIKKNAGQRSTVASQLLRFLDRLAQKLQLHFMSTPTTEIITNTTLKFHPLPYRQNILQKYHQKLSQLHIGDS